MSRSMEQQRRLAMRNNGGWYDFGCFVGIVFLGVGSHKAKTVTRTIYIDRGRR